VKLGHQWHALKLTRSEELSRLGISKPWQKIKKPPIKRPRSASSKRIKLWTLTSIFSRSQFHTSRQVEPLSAKN
jgi:hypothetical protein